jgi:hypothetical protein
VTDREVQHDPQGEDQLPRKQPASIDPYTPEPGPGRGERRAFGVLRLAWIVVAVVVAIVLVALLR